MTQRLPRTTRPSASARTPRSTEVGRRRPTAGMRLGVAVRDALVVVDDLRDDEAQERLGEHRVEAGGVGQGPQPGDLALLTLRVGGREVLLGLEPAHLLRALEALGEKVHERGVDVVDAAAQA